MTRVPMKQQVQPIGSMYCILYLHVLDFVYDACVVFF